MFMRQTSYSLAFRIELCLPRSPKQFVFICFLLQESLLTWFLKAEELPAFCDSLYCDSVGPPLVGSRFPGEISENGPSVLPGTQHLSYTDRSTTALLHGQDTSQQGPEPLARCARPAGLGIDIQCSRLGSPGLPGFGVNSSVPRGKETPQAYINLRL